MSRYNLRAENLHLWRGDRHVLKGVSLSANPGEVLQLTGVNGAGKTTLLRALCGLAHPEQGRVLWAGRDVRADLAGFHAVTIYLGHEAPLKPDLTARENLRFWIGLRRPLTATELDSALAETTATTFADRPVRTLSAGQKRRVALAGLLLCRAPLWLLDEPTTNLDTAGQALVSRLVSAHAAAGNLVIAAVHQGLQVEAHRLNRFELAA